MFLVDTQSQKEIVRLSRWTFGLLMSVREKRKLKLATKDLKTTNLFILLKGCYSYTTLRREG